MRKVRYRGCLTTESLLEVALPKKTVAHMEAWSSICGCGYKIRTQTYSALPITNLLLLPCTCVQCMQLIVARPWIAATCSSNRLKLIVAIATILFQWVNVLWFKPLPTYKFRYNASVEWHYNSKVCMHDLIIVLTRSFSTVDKHPICTMWWKRWLLFKTSTRALWLLSVQVKSSDKIEGRHVARSVCTPVIVHIPEYGNSWQRNDSARYTNLKYLSGRVND